MQTNNVLQTALDLCDLLGDGEVTLTNYGLVVTSPSRPAFAISYYRSEKDGRKWSAQYLGEAHAARPIDALCLLIDYHRNGKRIAEENIEALTNYLETLS